MPHLSTRRSPFPCRPSPPLPHPPHLHRLLRPSTASSKGRRSPARLQPPRPASAPHRPKTCASASGTRCSTRRANASAAPAAAATGKRTPAPHSPKQSSRCQPWQRRTRSKQRRRTRQWTSRSSSTPSSTWVKTRSGGQRSTTIAVSICISSSRRPPCLNPHCPGKARRR
ncbi:hypothetical protein BC567DRAFT_226062 [Phyllosticta citribraziliensis]